MTVVIGTQVVFAASVFAECVVFTAGSPVPKSSWTAQLLEDVFLVQSITNANEYTVGYCFVKDEVPKKL